MRAIPLFILLWVTPCLLTAGQAPTDIDRDGDVDLDDFSILQRCYSGTNVFQSNPTCQIARIDDDLDVDADDFHRLADCFSGPNIPASNLCTRKSKLFFPRESPWYLDMSASPLDTQSSTVISWLSGAGGWGGGRMQIDFSIEVMWADATAPFRTFTTTDDFYSPDCDHVAVPVPVGGALEGETGYECLSDGDCHLIVAHEPTHQLFEMWRANIMGGIFYGGCLSVWDMTRIYPANGRGTDCTSADAAGFPIAPLLFNADEVAAGWIDHAIRFILPNSRIRNRTYVHPATHATGAASGGSSAPPYGVRLRLRANYPLETLPNNAARVVARAMQRYGILLSDGGTIALTAQSDRFTTAKWSGLLDSLDLRTIQVSDFEMLDGGQRYTWTGDCVRNP